MKGYLVDYTTPYKDVASKVFIPAELYVAFLTCIDDQNAEVTAAVLTEYHGEDIPVANAESFGWLADIGDENHEKIIFIPDGHLDDVAHTLRLNGYRLSLIRWTNKIMFDTDVPQEVVL